ncbi:MAG: ribonuclease III [Bacilli bacterium]|jgi:ribonuclease-3|nr:ribonuclease III [Bacilli bacterium]
MAKDLALLYRKFGFAPHDPTLFELAFTHSSVNGMVGTRHRDYERLEFLGDAVVGMVTSELCFVYHPDMEQGDLSKLKSQFIRTESESAYGRKLGLDDFVRLGVSFQGDIHNASRVLEDVFESFIGALYLDQGLDFCYKFVRGLFEEDIKNAEVIPDINPKNELQEAMQAENKESVRYRILSEEGPAHAKRYVAAVYFEDQELGRGEGRSKKLAEVAAARNAMAKRAELKEGE